MQEEKKSIKEILDLLSPTHSFLIGIIGGLMLLCTIGFFVLIPMVSDGGVTRAENDTFKAPEKFSDCLDNGKYADVVASDTNLGVSLGVNGTPASFINGYLLSGALPYEEVKTIIDEVFAGKEPSSEYLARDEAGNLIKTDFSEDVLKDLDWKGDKNAKVTIIKFTDFECPYCTRFYNTLDQILTEYGDDIKFAYKSFPLSFHANAQKAAEAYECAREQGQWFEMYNELFKLAEAGNLGVNNYKKLADELGLK